MKKIFRVVYEIEGEFMRDKFYEAKSEVDAFRQFKAEVELNEHTMVWKIVEVDQIPKEESV